MRLLVIAFLSWMLVACSSPSIDQYANNEPKFDVTEFFNGKLTAHGILKDRSGNVIRYFNADLVGSWEQGVGTLDEWFVFDDGERQRRTWTLTPQGTNAYSATAGDVTGTGQLRTSGNALFMNYVLQIPYDGDTLEVAVDDKMYLVNPTTVINESILTKFGFEVGYLTLVIQQTAD
jgi:hypothetical protein